MGKFDAVTRGIAEALAEAIVGKRPKRRVPTPFEPQPLEKTLEQRAKFLRDWRTTARLVTMGSHRNRSNATVLVPNGPLGLRPQTHHRAPTKPERRRDRARQRQLQRVTLRSLTCAEQSRSSSGSWLGLS